MQDSEFDFKSIKAPEGFWNSVPISPSIPAPSNEEDDRWGDIAVPFIDSIKAPEGFWDPVPKKTIEKVSGSIIEDTKLSDMELHSSKKDFLSSKLKHLFGKGCHYQVRGNGFCFINAVFSILIRIYPTVANYDYDSFLKLFQMILKENGVVDESPDDLDAVLALTVTRKVLGFIGIHNTSFAIFSLNDFTISFNVGNSEIEHPVYRKDLFCILHNEGHFSGIYFNESDREELFDMLTFEMAM